MLTVRFKFVADNFTLIANRLDGAVRQETREESKAEKIWAAAAAADKIMMQC
jgi:hypothetical protein